jgi:hypothetical protein
VAKGESRAWRAGRGSARGEAVRTDEGEDGSVRSLSAPTEASLFMSERPPKSDEAAMTVGQRC